MVEIGPKLTLDPHADEMKWQKKKDLQLRDA